MKKRTNWIFVMLIMLGLVLVGCNTKVHVSDGKKSDKYQGVWYAQTVEKESMKITIKQNKMMLDNGESEEIYQYEQKGRGKVNGNPYYLLNIEELGTLSIVFTKDDSKKALLIEPFSKDDYTEGKKIASLDKSKPKNFALKEQKDAVDKIEDSSAKGKTVQKVQDTANKLKSIKVKSNILFEHSVDGKNDQRDIILGQVHIKHGRNAINSVWIKQQKNDEPVQEIYVDEGISYKREGNEWVEDKPVKNLTSDMDYLEGVKSLAAVYELCELEENDSEYLFTFKGKSAPVFDAIQPFFKLTIQGVETKDVNCDILYRIDKKTNELKEVHHHIDFGGGNENIVIDAKVEYTGYNTDFDIP